MPWKVALALITAVGLPPALAAAAPPPHRPNVIVVVADQWRAQALGCAGDINARTPNLDRLAAEGLRLTTAVSTCPVCSPFRGSLMTGQYPLTNGVFLNDVPLRPKGPALAEAFQKAGYQTACIGKWHLEGDGRSAFIPPQRRLGFEFWRACECTHDYNHSLYYGDKDEKLYWRGYDAEDQTQAAIQYIRQYHQRGPFLLFLSWGPPHNPYGTAPEAFRRQFTPEALTLRPNVPPQAAAMTRARPGRLLRPRGGPGRLHGPAGRQPEATRPGRRHAPGLHGRPWRHARLARPDPQAAALGRIDPRALHRPLAAGLGQ